MSKIDVLIAIPALPVVPVLATWWLPWENWIPRWKLPKLLVGSYVLYLSFAAWHFRLPWWIVMLLVGGGLVLVLMGLEERYGRDRADN
jgi:hypothetical protein